jgi:osmotically-inducible protein OsmY
MGWLQRLFGDDKPQAARVADMRDVNFQPTVDADEDHPPEQVGLEGDPDQNGLAKRVALALDQDNQIQDIPTLYIEQNNSTVLFKGTVPDQMTLTKVITIAQGVEGATEVNADEVSIAH